MAKTIFHPGKALTSKFLNAINYLGPSNPGVVFKANPINDFEYPLLKAESLDLSNLTGYFVTTSSNQNVGGLKNFNSIPTIPTSPLPVNGVYTNLNNAASVEFVKATTDGAVKTTGDQLIEGEKFFTNARVLTNTIIDQASVVNKDYIDLNAVTINQPQDISSLKNFLSSPSVPNPSLSNHAANKDYVDALISSLGLRQGTGFIQVGAIQIIFGSIPLYGVWGTNGPLTTGPVTYNAIAPGCRPFTYIFGASSCIDRQVVMATYVGSTDINFVADDSPVTPIIGQDGGIIRFIVAGQIN